MSNKRSLKKQIRYICDDLIEQCFLAKNFIPGSDEEKFNDIICDIVEFQNNALARTNISFDKVAKDFPSRNEYLAARKEYFSTAFKAFRKDFNERLEAIVAEMNKALPAKEEAKEEAK